MKPGVAFQDELKKLAKNAQSDVVMKDADGSTKPKRSSVPRNDEQTNDISAKSQVVEGKS